MEKGGESNAEKHLILTLFFVDIAPQTSKMN
jgi:hypothetical protein